MKSNIGKADRIVRIAVATMIIVLYTFSIISGTLGIVLLMIAGLLVLTSLVSLCPLYTILGITTCNINR